ncbi:ArnT family glycosyltransferase [Aquimarina rhabdastrellae]
MKDVFKKKEIFFLIIIHSVFFLITLYNGNYFLDDSYEYFIEAKNIISDFEFYCNDLTQAIDNRYYTKRPPLYSLFIILTSLFLKWKVGILLVQNIVSIVSILLVIKIVRELGYTLNNKIFLFFITLGISQFIYANLLMSEILFQFLIIVLCYQFIKLLKIKSWKEIVIFQLVIVLLFYTKPVFYLFVIPNLIGSFFLIKKIKMLWIGALIPVMALTGFSYWNYQRTGSYEISSIQNINLKDYNLKYFHINKYGEEYALQVNDEITTTIKEIKDYKEREAKTKTLVISYLKQDFISYVYFHLKGSVRMFLDPGRFDMYNFFTKEKSNAVGFLSILNKGSIQELIKYIKTQPIIIVIMIPLLLLINGIKLFGFCFFLIKNIKKITLPVGFVLFIICYIIGITGPLGASRFMVPILPLYTVVAVLGLEVFMKTYLKKLYLKMQ